MTSTATARAYDQIRSFIHDGRFMPGDWLKEDELTELCGVSRTPVREALRRLIAEGFVTKIPNHGAQVAEMGPTELEDVYSLRALLEGHAAGRAALHIIPEQIGRLKELATEMELAVRRGPQAIKKIYPTANANFHRIVLESAGNPRLLAMAQSVMEYSLVIRTLASFSLEDHYVSLRQHRELIRAFEARDPAWAAAVMQSHIYNAIHALNRDNEAAGETSI